MQNAEGTLRNIPQLAPGQWPGVHNRRSAGATTAAEDYEIAPEHRKASKLPLYIGKMGGDRRQGLWRRKVVNLTSYSGG